MDKELIKQAFQLGYLVGIKQATVLKPDPKRLVGTVKSVYERMVPSLKNKYHDAGTVIKPELKEYFRGRKLMLPIGLLPLISNFDYGA